MRTWGRILTSVSQRAVSRRLAIKNAWQTGATADPVNGFPYARSVCLASMLPNLTGKLLKYD